MAHPIDTSLCNGIPVDHRLQKFLASARQQHFQSVGNHANIIETFGDDLTRDDGSTPSRHEVDFASWLAKPDMTGGLVIALLQPAKSQVYTADVHWVKDQCASLAYLHDSLSFLDGSGGLIMTSVFDAFPFTTKHLPGSNPLPADVVSAYNTFLWMIEAKKPKIVFTCWRLPGQDGLFFSGKGLGQTDHTYDIALRSGHVVRVVNGFHPSYAANFHSNESCFRKLFSMELCKALCELNGAWREEVWMSDLRNTCRAKSTRLMRGNSSGTTISTSANDD